MRRVYLSGGAAVAIGSEMSGGEGCPVIPGGSARGPLESVRVPEKPPPDHAQIARVGAQGLIGTAVVEDDVALASQPSVSDFVLSMFSIQGGSNWTGGPC